MSDISRILSQTSIGQEYVDKSLVPILIKYIVFSKSLKENSLGNMLHTECMKDLTKVLVNILKYSKNPLILTNNDLQELCSILPIDLRIFKMNAEDGKLYFERLSQKEKFKDFPINFLGTQDFTEKPQLSENFKFNIKFIAENLALAIQSLMPIFDEATLERLCMDHFACKETFRYAIDFANLTPFQHLYTLSIYAQSNHFATSLVLSHYPLDRKSQEELIDIIFNKVKPHCAAIILSSHSVLLKHLGLDKDCKSITLPSIERFKYMQPKPQDITKLQNAITSYLKELPLHFALYFIKENYALFFEAEGAYKSLRINESTVDQIFTAFTENQTYYEAYQAICSIKLEESTPLPMNNEKYLALKHHNPEKSKLLPFMNNKHVALLLANIAPLLIFRNMPDLIINQPNLMLSPDDFEQLMKPIPFVLCEKFVRIHQAFNGSQLCQQQWLIYINTIHYDNPYTLDVNMQIVGENDDGFIMRQIKPNFASYILAAQYCSKMFVDPITCLDSPVWAKKIIYAMDQLANSNQINTIPNNIVEHLFAGFSKNKEFTKQISSYHDNPKRIALFKEAAKVYQGELFANGFGFDFHEHELDFVKKLCLTYDVALEAYLLQYLTYDTINNVLKNNQIGKQSGVLNNASLEMLNNLKNHLTQQEQLFLESANKYSNVQFAQYATNKPENHCLVHELVTTQFELIMDEYKQQDRMWWNKSFKEIKEKVYDGLDMEAFFQTNEKKYLTSPVPNYSNKKFDALLKTYQQNSKAW